jgi:hypothetical protein
MRYINLVPEVKPKLKLTGNDKYQQYLLNNIEYRNRPDRKAFMKVYYAEYRREHGGLIECDCGSILKEISMYNHVKSNKHINYLTS